MGMFWSSPQPAPATAEDNNTPTTVQKIAASELVAKYPAKTIIVLNGKFYDVTKFKSDHVCKIRCPSMGNESEFISFIGK